MRSAEEQMSGRGTPLSAWSAYAVCAVTLTTVLALIVSALVSRGNSPAIWFGAGIACVVQLVSFAGLLAVRDQQHLLLAGWVGGMVLRFGAVGILALWLSRSVALPREAALISLVGFVFLLLLMEPVFLRWDLRRS